MAGINDITTAFSMGTNKCQWCGLYHGPNCPRVAAIEYHPDGAIKRVEFFDAKGANGRAEFVVGMPSTYMAMEGGE